MYAVYSAMEAGCGIPDEEYQNIESIVSNLKWAISECARGRDDLWEMIVDHLQVLLSEMEIVYNFGKDDIMFIDKWESDIEDVIEVLFKNGFRMEVRFNRDGKRLRASIHHVLERL